MSRRRLPIDPEGIYHVDTRGSFGMPLFTTTGEHELYLELYALLRQVPLANVRVGAQLEPRALLGAPR